MLALKIWRATAALITAIQIGLAAASYGAAGATYAQAGAARFAYVAARLWAGAQWLVVAAMNEKLIQEIVHLRRGPVDDPLERTVKKRRLGTSRAPDAIQQAHVAKIGMVRIAAKNHVAVNRLPTTLIDCARFIDELVHGGRSSEELIEDVLVSRFVVGRELL